MHFHRKLTFAFLTTSAAAGLLVACTMGEDSENPMSDSHALRADATPTATATGTTTAPPVKVRPVVTAAPSTTAPPVTALGTKDRCCCGHDSERSCDGDGGAEKYEPLSCTWIQQSPGCSNSEDMTEYNTQALCDVATGKDCDKQCKHNLDKCQADWGDH